MTARLSLKPGSEVVWRGRNCKILEVVTASKVLVEVLSTNAKEVAVVSKLRPRKNAEEEGSVRVLDGLAPEDLAEAKRRFSIIKPLVRCERRSEEDVQRVVERHGVPRTTLYRWIKRYEGRRRLSDLAPTRRGRKMPKRLAPEVEAIITSVIDEPNNR
ncbi:MAG TPA: helix-turn-helix domain-containing protein [Magnetospirillum sp.]|nr:helix-turn-helix domain-containing protein [Magnetospirillum sp.]